MNIFWYTVVFTAFLNECNGGSDFDNSPIRFACITKESQHEFDITDVNDRIPSALARRLNNGNDLSLFFHGVKTMIDNSFDSFCLFAVQWYLASGKNICIVSYAFAKNSSEVSKMDPPEIARRMVKTKRLQHVAEMARDLVLYVREKCLATTKPCLRNLSQVDVSGFSFGAHIAGKTCKYLLKETKEKVRLLLALDPLKSSKINHTIRKGDAHYVQVVHTSEKVGMWDQMGDVDIYVTYKEQKKMGALIDKHNIAFLIHVATSGKQLYMWAGQNSDGHVHTMLAFQPVDECTIGVHATKPKHGKTLNFNFTESSLQRFWLNFRLYDLIELSSGEVEKNENLAPEDECAVCRERKKNVKLDCPCKSPRICMICWYKLEAGPKSNVKCPVCMQPVTSGKRV